MQTNLLFTFPEYGRKVDGSYNLTSYFTSMTSLKPDRKGYYPCFKEDAEACS